jgi:hypothetical protein
MNSNHSRPFFLGVAVASVIFVGAPMVRQALAQSASAAPAVPDKPYIVEWVYKVKYGYQDEFFDIFRKYQVPILDREKELGYVTNYTIYSPSLHTSEDARWDYRVIITYRNQSSAGHASEITKQLFPDDATLKREERRRWELTLVHWDLPIHTVDPKAGTE